MTDFIIDTINAELTPSQNVSLAQFQLKMLAIQNLPNFDQSTLDDPQYHSIEIEGRESLSSSSPSSSPVRIGLDVIATKEFKKAIEGLMPQTLKDGVWKNVKHDDPDSLVVRHLKARDFDVDVALKMMLGSVRWRIETGVVDRLLAGGDERLNELALSGTGDTDERRVAREVMAQLRSGKSFAHGTDKTGRPLLFVRVAKHNPRMQALDGFGTFAVFQAETARMTLRPPHTDAAVIFDLGGFSMSNMDWNAIKILTMGLEEKYPESTGVTFVYRAPWIINSIWAIVKTMMPGKEAQKVRFVKDAKALSEFVDLKYLPSDMGGTGNYEYEYIEPVAGENNIQKDTSKLAEVMKKHQAVVEEYETAAREWAELIILENAQPAEQSGADQAIPNGVAEHTTDRSVAAAERRKRDTVLKMRIVYWEMDPYVRGKTMLDRSKVLGPGGQVNRDHL